MKKLVLLKRQKRKENKMVSKDYKPNYNQFPSEFLSDGDMYNIFAKNGLHMARMISGSKSLYRNFYPDNLVIFNANVVIESRGKVWHGDLDVTLDMEALKAVANELGEPLYILSEMDGRFGNENRDFDFYKSVAKTVIEPDNKE